MAEFVSLEIDCREFRLRPNPFRRGNTAWHLFGSPRDQWKAWYHERRAARRADYMPAPIQGEIGTWEGVRFITS